MKKMIKDTVWKISIITKYGTDVILVNQPKEPTQAQLDKLEKKWKKEFDIDDESEYPYIEVLGQIYKNKVREWQEQLAKAQIEGRFGFTSYPVLTSAYLG